MLNVHEIIQAGGLLAIAAIIFAESGLLIGFFLPGDSLLLAAGLFAANGHLPIGWLILTVIISAIVGYEVGYVIGGRAGPKVFKRKDGLLFREEYVGRTEKFFNKYGGLTVLLARFVAHVRTFVSVIAGASRMDRAKYTFYNVLGAILWGGGVTLLSYWLGKNIPNFENYIVWSVVITLAVLYSFGGWKLAQTPQKRQKLKKGLKEDWDYFFGGKKS